MQHIGGRCAKCILRSVQCAKCLLCSALCFVQSAQQWPVCRVRYVYNAQPVVHCTAQNSRVVMCSKHRVKQCRVCNVQCTWHEMCSSQSAVSLCSMWTIGQLHRVQHAPCLVCTVCCAACRVFQGHSAQCAAHICCVHSAQCEY